MNEIGMRVTQYGKSRLETLHSPLLPKNERSKVKNISRESRNNNKVTGSLGIAGSAVEKEN